MDVEGGGGGGGVRAEEGIRKIGFRNTVAKMLRMRMFVAVIVLPSC